MRVAVLGAGGIVGQTMMVRKPDWAEAEFVRKTDDTGLYEVVNLTNPLELETYLDRFRPEVIINLAGINQVDLVEANPGLSLPINVEVPEALAKWSDRYGKLIHVSTQAVFDGTRSPYYPYDKLSPVNEYGAQKTVAESHVRVGLNWLIVRLTFVLGIRPFPAIGRMNPLESMIVEPVQRRVSDMSMSIVAATDAADLLWTLCQADENKQIIHVGSAIDYSQYRIAQEVAEHTGATIGAIKQEEFKDAAPRPKQVRWGTNAVKQSDLGITVTEAIGAWMSQNKMDLDRRAREISLFIEGVSFEQAKEQLAQGFHHNHALVAKDFLDYGAKTNDSESLLNWYLDTEAYIWELSAYHLEEGFNYSGMCEGIVNHLARDGKERVLCLGDGIGDLSLAAAKKDLKPIYHDLEGSRTAEFAQFRFSLNHPVDVHLTNSFDPVLPSELDAVVALDFFEHLPNVEVWVKEVYRALKPGGMFLAQNAFGIGDAEHGNSIPMHLSVNNKYVKEWDPLLHRTGFVPTGAGTWWTKT